MPPQFTSVGLKVVKGPQSWNHSGMWPLRMVLSTAQPPKDRTLAISDSSYT